MRCRCGGRAHPIESRCGLRRVGEGASSEGRATQQISFGRHLSCLRFLRKHKCPWDSRLIANAARGGHLLVIKWARNRKHPCPWSEAACAEAAAGGHLEVSAPGWSAWELVRRPMGRCGWVGGCRQVHPRLACTSRCVASGPHVAARAPLPVERGNVRRGREARAHQCAPATMRHGPPRAHWGAH